MNKKLIALSALALTIGFTSVNAAEMGAKDEPIKLAINEWTEQHISTHITGETLKKAGYNVEYETAGYYYGSNPAGDCG